MTKIILFLAKQKLKFIWNWFLTKILVLNIPFQVAPVWKSILEDRESYFHQDLFLATTELTERLLPESQLNCIYFESYYREEVFKLKIWSLHFFEIIRAIQQTGRNVNQKVLSRNVKNINGYFKNYLPIPVDCFYSWVTFSKSDYVHKFEHHVINISSYSLIIFFSQRFVKFNKLLICDF